MACGPEGWVTDMTRRGVLRWLLSGAAVLAVGPLRLLAARGLPRLGPPHRYLDESVVSQPAVWVG